MNRDRILILGGVVIGLVFGIWFIPLFVRNITRTPNDQRCYLNDRIREMNYRGYIIDVWTPTGSPAAVMFKLSGGDEISFSKSRFGQELEQIVEGDQLVKQQGDLELHILKQHDTLSFNLDNGCRHGLPST